MATAALAPADFTKTLDTWQILSEWEHRKKRYLERDEWYAKLLSYLSPWNSDRGGIQILAANAQGRPLLRPIGETIRTARTYSSQRLPPIVDDYMALIGRMPTTRTEPPDTSEQGEKKAELLTKFLYSTYELSSMEHQQAQSGFYLSGLGDSVYVLEPDADTLRVAWNVLSPMSAWPSFYHGFKRFEVYDLITSEVWTPEDIVRQLGIVPDNDSEENCTVVTYISPYQRTQVVGQRAPVQAAHVDWDLGFCPVVWAFNRVPGKMGMSDIGFSLGQQDFLDFALNVGADGIVHNTYPMIGIKNPMQVGDGAPTVGPGAPPITLQGDGDIIVRNTQGDVRALTALIEHTLQDITSTTGSSQVRQEGQMKSSITTGRAVQSVQGPQSTRLDFKQQVLGAAIEAANRMTLAMQERAPLLKTFKGPVYGNVRGRSFREEFDASQDIDGWHRTKVTWPALVGMNMQQKAAVAYEMMVAKLIDDLEAREIVGVEDPIGMRDRIKTQMMQEAQLQGLMAQVQQQPQGQGQPGQGGPTPHGTSPNGQPMTQPPGLLARPATLGQQPGQAPPPASMRGPSQSDWTNELAKIADKLKGSVWLAPDGQILVSDHRDYVIVLEVARKSNPLAKVKQMSESRMPEGSTRLV